jgi:SAM domain (Sterile alpha motif)
MSMSDIRQWLRSLGLEKYNEVLTGHDIDLTVVPELTEQDLGELGFSLGHRRKFLAAAGQLRTTTAASAVASAQVQPPVQPASAAELSV